MLHQQQKELGLLFTPNTNMTNPAQVQKAYNVQVGKSRA